MSVCRLFPRKSCVHKKEENKKYVTNHNINKDKSNGL